jgi:predicted nucleic acid-binding protein
MVVSDAGPLRYLILVGEAASIPILFGDLIVPTTVLHELTAPASPAEVKLWIDNLPVWAADRNPTYPEIVERRGLDPGERSAIALAAELNPGYLLMDDQAGRLAAPRYTNATVSGTVGVLHRASQLTPTQPRQRFLLSIAKLKNTNFYFSQDLLATIDLLASRLPP